MTVKANKADEERAEGHSKKDKAGALLLCQHRSQGQSHACTIFEHIYDYGPLPFVNSMWTTCAV